MSDSLWRIMLYTQRVEVLVVPRGWQRTTQYVGIHDGRYTMKLGYILEHREHLI